jgi:hypothetical protein
MVYQQFVVEFSDKRFMMIMYILTAVIALIILIMLGVDIFIIKEPGDPYLSGISIGVPLLIGLLSALLIYFKKKNSIQVAVKNDLMLLKRKTGRSEEIRRENILSFHTYYTYGNEQHLWVD